ncbi:uncharacterized protein DEA37_0008508 [Paragonimus westermani]|uniref:Uncharacterized protein n=1 Tax=Paragonimus westermani TaxID=34504 RepID=A0A5J4P265_9TREM|nr:uncharacterized protein DEA37_0008508 [Paragonimus westermani]
MGVIISRQSTPTRPFHKPKPSFSRKKGTRDVVTKVGTIDLLEEELLISSHKQLLPVAHKLVASIRTSDIMAKEKLPVSTATRSFSLQQGDHVSEVDVSRWNTSGLNLKGDSQSESSSEQVSPDMKRVQPIMYKICLKVREGPLTRLLFLELYELDMRIMKETEFIQWAQMAKLPMTAEMYKTFQHDANTYAIKRRLTAIEKRFDVRFILGDREPMPLVGKKLKVEANEGVRQLTIFGEVPCKIAAATNYFGATLNQVKSAQLLLPNDHPFSISPEVCLMHWIVPRPPDTGEPVLMRLREHGAHRTITDEV